MTVPVETEPTSAPLTDDERAELLWLRTENEFLRVQRDILMRVATGYAQDVETMLRRINGHH